LSDQGTTFIFMGHTENHSRNVYGMPKMTTNSIIYSRDIIWLNKMYNEWENIKSKTFNKEEEAMKLPTGMEKTNLTKVIQDRSSKTEKKVFRAIKTLDSWFNPQALRAIDDYNHGSEISLEQVNWLH
jgi:hypothetical protein